MLGKHGVCLQLSGTPVTIVVGEQHCSWKTSMSYRGIWGQKDEVANQHIFAYEDHRVLGQKRMGQLFTSEWILFQNDRDCCSGWVISWWKVLRTSPLAM